MALLDIVLATYKGEKYIDALLASLVKQSFTNWRLIVRDDNSSDSTVRKLEFFKNTVKQEVVILTSDSRMGIKSNFSALLEYSTAPYVMLADQDDVWLPHKIAISIAAIQKMDATKPALVHTDLIVVDKDLNTISNSFIHTDTDRYCVYYYAYSALFYARPPFAVKPASYSTWNTPVISPAYLFPASEYTVIKKLPPAFLWQQSCYGYPSYSVPCAE